MYVKKDKGMVNMMFILIILTIEIVVMAFMLKYNNYVIEKTMLEDSITQASLSGLVPDRILADSTYRINLGDIADCFDKYGTILANQTGMTYANHQIEGTNNKGILNQSGTYINNFYVYQATETKIYQYTVMSDKTYYSNPGKILVYECPTGEKLADSTYKSPDNTVLNRENTIYIYSEVNVKLNAMHMDWFGEISSGDFEKVMKQTVNVSNDISIHEWDTGVVIKQPTATEDGSIKYTCLDCHITRTEILPRTGSAPLNDFNYATSDTNKITINSYLKTETTVNIPATYVVGNLRYTVTELGPNCFKNNTSIKNLNIADGININNATSLCEGCTNLEVVTLPKNTTVIPANAFKNCTSLKKINIPAGATILPTALEGCNAIVNRQ